jgi:anti-sigma factor RsiW
MSRRLPRWLTRLARRDAPMDCAQVGALLQHFLDGQLDAPRAARLRAHLDDCLRCGLEADTYRRIKRALADHRSPVPAASLERLEEFGRRLAAGGAHDL